MDVDEIKAIVNQAVAMRPPRFEEQTPPRVKVDVLENYLLEAGYAQAELEAVLHWLDLLVAHFAQKIADMTGYEVMLPRKRTERITRDDVLQAKRQTDPVAFELGAEMKQLRTTALRQIDRLRFEVQFVVSRAFTMISGQ